MQPGDGLEGLAQLEDRLRAIARRLTPPEDPKARYGGRDPTGAVWAAVTGAGRVCDVRVNGAWRDQLAPEELGAAVRQAVAAATTGRLNAWGEAVAALADVRVTGRVPAAVDTPLEFTGWVAPAGPTATNLLLSELMSMLEQVAASVGAVAAQLEDRLAATYRGRSGSRHVAVSIGGDGQLVEVEYEPRWLAAAPATSIARQTSEAFTAAYSLAGQRSLVDVIAESPLGELQRLVSDPLAFARRLGLRQET